MKLDVFNRFPKCGCILLLLLLLFSEEEEEEESGGGKREAAILGRKVTNFPGQIEATKDEREAMEKRREQPFYRQNKRNKAGN